MEHQRSSRSVDRNECCICLNACFDLQNVERFPIGHSKRHKQRWGPRANLNIIKTFHKSMSSGVRLLWLSSGYSAVNMTASAAIMYSSLNSSDWLASSW